MRTGFLFLLAALLPLLPGPAGAADGAVPFPRLISVGGDVTEIVFALGSGGHVVAIDDTSLFPAHAQDLPSVGYLRTLAAEGILSLGPTLVLASNDAGPPIVLEQIAAAGVGVVHVPDDPSTRGIGEKITVIAKALNRETEGRILASQIRVQMDMLSALVARAGKRPKVLFVLNMGQGAPMAAGRDTAADAAIALAGGVNPLARFRGYKPLSPEGSVAAAPDVILVMDHALAAMGGIEALLAQPAIALTPAGKAGAVVVVDGLALLGFGPRTPGALEALARKLHPGLGS